MRNCPNEVEKWDFLHGLSSPSRRKDFEHHLASCPDCRAEMEKIHDLDAGLRTMPLPQTPDCLAAATKDALRRAAREFEEDHGRVSLPPGRRGGRHAAIRPILVFSICLAIMFVLLAVLLPGALTFPSWRGLWKAPSLPGLPKAAADFALKVLGLSPLLLIPSIIENARLLLRRKRS